MAQSSNRCAPRRTLRNWAAMLPAFVMLAEDVDRSLTAPLPLPVPVGAFTPATPSRSSSLPVVQASEASKPATAREEGPVPCSLPRSKEPLRGRIDRAVVSAARDQLNALFSLPMGSGRRQTINGQGYLFCLEPHYHPPGGGAYPEGWHKGVTVYRTTADA